MNKTDYTKEITAAKSALTQGNFTLAVNMLQNLFDVFPDNEEVLIYYACALLETGDPIQCFELANQAVDLRPDLMYLKNLRGHLFARMGLNEGAASDLADYTNKLNGEQKASTLYLIRAYAGSCKFESAINLTSEMIDRFEWPELIDLMDYLQSALEIHNRKGEISKAKIVKSLKLAKKAFENGEFWYSKYVSGVIEKNDSIKIETKKEAVILLIESLVRLYQYKPALTIANKYAEEFKSDFSFNKLVNDLKNVSNVFRSGENKHADRVEEPEKSKNSDSNFFPSETLQVASTKFFDVAEDLKSDKRNYYKQFSGRSIKYVGLEIIFKNKFYKLRKRNYKGYAVWYQNDFEIGKSYFKLNINENWDSVIYVQTWGSDEPFYWESGKGKVELYIDNFKVSESAFYIGKEKILADEKQNEGQRDRRSEEDTKTKTSITTQFEENSLDELLDELNNYVGLGKIKNSIQEFIDYLEFIKERKKLGLKVQEGISLNSVFLGNPGTGKTTIARLMAKIFKAMGLLPENKLVEVDRAALVGQYIGETAHKTEKVIESAIGGVLFIDEAYSLTKKGNSQDFGQEAIDVLMKRMEDKKSEFAVIVAGYPEEMKNFLMSNPGMQSRFSHTFDFEDYSPSELMEIINKLAEEEDYSLEDEAMNLLEKEFTKIYRTRDKTFGNARLVRKFFEEAKIQVGKRYLGNGGNVKDKESLSLIVTEDINQILKKDTRQTEGIPIDEEALSDVMKQFNNLIGLEGIKKEINDVIKLARFYTDRGENIRNKFSSHILFLGNPGTGKTTVARLLSKLYSALGILEKGHLVETDREGMVAGYVGQTAIKTKQLISESIGGTLFIDEAYSLDPNKNTSDFSKEAIDVLLKKMEDERGKFLTIAAGYTEEMKSFIGSNPGLKSRFNKTFVFDDYTPSELLKIAENIFSDQGLQVDLNAQNLLLKYFEFLYSKRDNHFGNARVIRTICEEIKKQALLRAADSSSTSNEIIVNESDISKVYSGAKTNFTAEKDDTDKILEEIRLLPGLKNVKRGIEKLVSGLKISAIRKQKGLKNISKPMHCIFTGNPGTGKSTIANYIGSILREMKFLSSGNVLTIGNLETIRNKNIDINKLQSILQDQKGEVFYIPDISPYHLLNDDDARQFLQTIFHYAQKQESIVILSGKQEIVYSFINRFADYSHNFTNYFTFDDYTPRELLEITAYIASSNGYTLDEGALQQMLDIFTEMYNHRDNNFTNAFAAQKILNQAISKQEERITENNIINDEELNLLILDDIQKIENTH